nr:hypothetical protein [Pandoravirus aubagnensis]
MAAPEASDWHLCRHHPLDFYSSDFFLFFLNTKRSLAEVSALVVVGVCRCLSPALRKESVTKKRRVWRVRLQKSPCRNQNNKGAAPYVRIFCIFSFFRIHRISRCQLEKEWRKQTRAFRLVFACCLFFMNHFFPRPTTSRLQLSISFSLFFLMPFCGAPTALALLFVFSCSFCLPFFVAE